MDDESEKNAEIGPTEKTETRRNSVSSSVSSSVEKIATMDAEKESVPSSSHDHTTPPPVSVQPPTPISVQPPPPISVQPPQPPPVISVQPVSIPPPNANPACSNASSAGPPPAGPPRVQIPSGKSSRIYLIPQPG